ncbi:MAG: exo-alpha-sialidase [Oscillospiraceae bacterium]|nr:exo-alpha-sialidase [Oscillospiraceae bacterium]MBQ6697436.1 exo-alpha-sialidase [Oscillospiraceae bacterium]
MKREKYVIRKGFDKKKCLVHARCCHAPHIMLATAQYLNVSGSDLFSGLLMSTSRDGGKTWSEFSPQAGLEPIRNGEYLTVGCDATPIYHPQSSKILLLGHTAEYKDGDMQPTGRRRHTFYSIFDEAKNEFSKMQFLVMPEGFERCGNGSGQSVILQNGEILVPVYYSRGNKKNMYSMVLRCLFDGKKLKVIETGAPLTIPVERGAYEPSLVFHKDTYYMTMRNDECGLVAKSRDGLNFTDMQLWKWDDGSLLDTYNTQQHWMTLGDDLYLVYTRRGADNDHVFRHRAPLFAARVDNMRLVRESEFVVIEERGARLGNFGVSSLADGKAIVMAAEWMQPAGCEKFGSDNSVFLSVIE